MQSEIWKEPKNLINYSLSYNQTFPVFRIYRCYFIPIAIGIKKIEYNNQKK